MITIKDVKIGGGAFTVIAGPCAIESEEQINTVAKLVADEGAEILRGGAFKPRTSPYDFQGLGEEGLKLMRAAADRHGLLCVSEVMTPEDIPLVAKYVDILQIGSRNMHNSALLKAVGERGLPVVLKRGLSASYVELLQAAEYIMVQGNKDIILCERGIRTFETYTRNTLDIAAVLALRDLTHLPVVVDPSHGTGHAHMVGPMAKASKVVGADGVMVEVHNDPSKALCDGQQSLAPEQFSDMVTGLKAL
jgi:3-deoxy-7-phosphoheptulonate synthase